MRSILAILQEVGLASREEIQSDHKQKIPPHRSKEDRSEALDPSTRNGQFALLNFFAKGQCD